MYLARLAPCSLVLCTSTNAAASSGATGKRANSFLSKTGNVAFSALFSAASSPRQIQRIDASKIAEDLGVVTSSFTDFSVPWTSKIGGNVTELSTQGTTTGTGTWLSVTSMRDSTHVYNNGQAAPVHQHSGYSPLHAHGICLTAHTHCNNPGSAAA